jgi:nitric oxide reductase activation protein
MAEEQPAAKSLSSAVKNSSQMLRNGLNRLRRSPDELLAHLDAKAKKAMERLRARRRWEA